MAHRGTLHINQLEAFKIWCAENGIAYRDGKGEWQVLQVQVKSKKFNGWACIYKRADMPEHYTVQDQLIRYVKGFLASRKQENRVDYGLEQLRDRIQYAQLELNRLQDEHKRLTGSNYAITGPRSLPKVESRDCIYINYTPAEGQRPHSPEFPSCLEFEGEGPGGIAIAEYLNESPYSPCLIDDILAKYESAMSKEAEDRAADEADSRYEQIKDRRLCRPINEADWGFDD